MAVKPEPQATNLALFRTMRVDSLVFSAQGADISIQQPGNSGDEARRETRSRAATPSALSHTLFRRLRKVHEHEKPLDRGADCSAGALCDGSGCPHQGRSNQADLARRTSRDAQVRHWPIR